MNKIKFFMAKHIDEIEDNINAFLDLDENIDIEVINLYEVCKYNIEYFLKTPLQDNNNIEYCFCLVYKEEKDPLIEMWSRHNEVEE